VNPMTSCRCAPRPTPPPGLRKNVQHIAFPRGPSPQYYRYSRQLNFAVRMGSGDPA
jgi:hypothetical protein